jgi:lysophospholipase L1-like esterase
MSSPPQKKAPSTATLAVPVVIFGLSIGAASALLGGACEHAPEHKPEAATLTTPSLKHGATPPQILAEDPAPPEEPRPEVAVALPEGMRPIEDESGVALDPFFAKLRRVEADEPVQARVLHYGDSHIAADLWTGRARELLQERFGDAGAGFVLPGKPWKGYNPRAARTGMDAERWWTAERIRSREVLPDVYLGLGGYSMRSAHRGSSVWAATRDEGAWGTKVGRFEVFYLEQPGGGQMELYLDGKRVKEVTTRGAAPKAGYVVQEVPDGPHALELKVAGGGEVRLFGVTMERPQEPGVVYDFAGINGARFTMPQSWDQELWGAHLTRRSPDLLVTTYGTNEVDDQLDAEAYKAKVVKVLQTMREAVPGAACLLVGPPDRAWSYKRANTPSQEALERGNGDPSRAPVWETPQSLIALLEIEREAAREAGCGFWSTYDFMGGKGSMDRWARMSPPLAQGDRVHLTGEGYRRVAEGMVEALMFEYERYKRRTNDPSEPVGQR